MPPSPPSGPPRVPPPPSQQTGNTSADVLGGVDHVLSILGIVVGGYVLLVLLRFVCIKRRDAKDVSFKTWLANEGVIRVKHKQNGQTDEEAPVAAEAAELDRVERARQAILDRRLGKLPLPRTAAEGETADADAAASRDAAAKALAASPHLLAGSRDAVTDKGALLAEAAEAAAAGAGPSSGRQWLGSHPSAAAVATPAAAAGPPPLSPPSPPSSLASPDPAPDPERRRSSHSSRPCRSSYSSHRSAGSGDDGTGLRRQSGDGTRSRRQSADGASSRRRSGGGTSPRRQSGEDFSTRENLSTIFRSFDLSTP